MKWEVRNQNDDCKSVKSTKPDAGEIRLISSLESVGKERSNS